jgi:hypothetical protein
MEGIPMSTIFAMLPLILVAVLLIVLWRTGVKRSAFFIIVLPLGIIAALLLSWIVFKISVHWVIPGIERDWSAATNESIAIKTADGLAKNPSQIPAAQALEGMAKFVTGGGAPAVLPAPAAQAPAASGGGQVQLTPVPGGGRSVISTPAPLPTTSPQQAALAQAMAFTPPTSVNKEMAASLKAVLGQLLTGNNFPAGPGNDGFPYAGATDKRAWFPAGVRCKEAFRYLTDWHSIRCWLGPQDNDHIVFSVDANGKFYDFGNTSFDGVSPWPATMIQAFCAVNASSWPTCPSSTAAPAAPASPAVQPTPASAAPPPAGGPPAPGGPGPGDGSSLELPSVPGAPKLGEKCETAFAYNDDKTLVCSRTCGMVWRAYPGSSCP